MKIMSVNAGSSSLKFSLFDMDNNEVIVSGLFERIGIENPQYTIKYQGYKIKEEALLNNHSDAVRILLEKLIDLNIVQSLDEINGVGHRVVHGGDKYCESVMVTDQVIEDIMAFSDFAPLHNPNHVICIKAFKEQLPNTPMTVVFDTAFHQTMSEEQYLYPIPYKWFKEHKVRKYGAHGTSHRYIAKIMSETLKKENLKIISCHIGNGASITAIKDGKCIDTSMGFTPLAGVMMGTRSGDIDVSIIPYVMEKEGMSAGEIINDLNKKSGLLGISELSSDSRDIEDGINAGNEKCILAQKMYINSMIKYIAHYYVELGGADVICFTAGVGENSKLFREQVIEKLSVLGIKLDLEANNTRGELKCISSKDSSCLVYVTPTDEELMIALDTMEIINR